MKKPFVAAMLAAALAAPNVAAYAKKPEVSGLELQQMQSRDYEVGKNVTFPAVMSVLQDEGYRIQAADRDTGLITGIASTSGKLTWTPFVGFGRSKKTPVVSAYIEDRGAGLSRIRLNFVMGKVSSNGYGSTEDEKPILDPAVYQDAFEKIEKAVFIRQAMDSPKAPVTMPASSQTPPAPIAQ